MSTCSGLTLTASHQPHPPTSGGVVGCSWVWLGVVGCGWVWLGVAGCGGVWLLYTIYHMCPYMLHGQAPQPQLPTFTLFSISISWFLAAFALWGSSCSLAARGAHL